MTTDPLTEWLDALDAEATSIINHVVTGGDPCQLELAPETVQALIECARAADNVVASYPADSNGIHDKLSEALARLRRRALGDA